MAEPLRGDDAAARDHAPRRGHDEHDHSVLVPDVPAAQEAAEGSAATARDAIASPPVPVRHINTRSIAITGLFVLAVFYTLYVGRYVFLPFALAMLFNFLFSPLIRALRRVRIPAPVGAGIVLVGLIALIAGAGYQLVTPAETWLARAPKTLASMDGKLRTIRRPVEQMTKTAEQVAQVTSGAATPARAQPVLVEQGQSVGERLMGNTETIVAGLIETLILLYFLLAAGDMFLHKLIKVLPQFRDKKRAVEIARATEASISTYLITVAMVNVGEGIVVALVMLALHMPNALLWGVLTALLEFVPYVGAVTMVTVLTFGGFATFPSVAQALLIPAAYLAINLIQANLVSPMILGRRLTLNPVAIFLGLMIWWELWGVAGAFIAVPLLATIKIVCDHIEPLAPIGEFLGR